MSEFLKKIVQSKYRPIIHINTPNGKLECLVDTGANINIFTLGSGYLESYFPNAVPVTRYKTRITGFGNGVTPSSLYLIDRLKIESDDTLNDDAIVFEHTFIACCDKPEIGAGLVLAFGMFRGIDLLFKQDVSDFGEICLYHKLTVYNGNLVYDINTGLVLRTMSLSQSEIAQLGDNLKLLSIDDFERLNDE